MKRATFTLDVSFNIDREIPDDADDRDAWDVAEEIGAYDLMQEALKDGTYTLFDVEVNCVEPIEEEPA